MKFNVTINDLSFEQMQEIMTKIGSKATVIPTPFVDPKTLPTNAAPIPPVATAGVLPQQPIPTAAPVADNSGLGVDAEGLPHDARIHSSSKKKNANQTWSRRKNVDEGVWNTVRAELFARGNGGATIPPVGGNIPPAPILPAAVAPAAPLPSVNPNDLPAFLQRGVPGAPVAAPTAAPAMMPAQPAYAPPPAAPVMAAPIPPAAAPMMPPAQPPAPPAQGTFADLFGKIQQMLQMKTMDVNYLNSLTQRLSQRWSVQVNAINDIANRPDMVMDAFALLAADGK